MAKHFTITITDDALTFTRNAPQIAADATFMVYPQFTPVQARAFTNNCDDDKFCDLRLYSA